jgi:hypothetical protein
MAELRGGTTIAGYTALHSGLKEAYLSGNLTMGANIKMPSGGEIWSGYNNAYVFKDHGNGAITLSAAGGNLHLGYNNTASVRLNSNLVSSDGTKTIASTSGTLYYQGVDADTRWLTLNTNPYMGNDLDGNTSYPRLVAKNSGASTPDWIRVGTSGGYGLLPYSNGTSSLGTSSWKFKEIHSVTFYQNGSTLDSLYAAAGHNHDTTYVKLTGSTMTGDIVMNDTTERAIKGSSLSAGLYINSGNIGFYDWKNNRGILSYQQSGNGAMNLYSENITANIGALGTFLIVGGSDATLSAGSGYLQIGMANNINIVLDENEIQARNNGAASSLNLNLLGGNVTIGSSGATTTINTLSTSFPLDSTIRIAGYEAIQFKAGPDANGRGILIGSGGTTVIGSGEAVSYFRDGWGPGNNWGIENTYLTSDNGIYFLTGQNAGYSYAPIVNMYSTNRLTAKPQFNPSTKEEEIKTFYDSGSGATAASGYTSIASDGWYTIAYNGETTTPGTGAGGNRAFAKFTCMDTSSGNHHLIQFTAGTAYNSQGGCGIVQLANIKYGATNEVFGGIRILTGGTYDTQYLQVFVSAGNVVRFIMEDNYWNTGWIPLNWSRSPVADTIPTGYTDNKMELQGGFLNRPQTLLSGTSSPPSQGAFPGDVYIQY